MPQLLTVLPLATEADVPTDPSSEHPWREALRDVAPHLDLGWRLVSAVAGPTLLGWVLDAALHTSPWGLLLGAGLGLAGAAYILVHLYHTPPSSNK